MSNRIIRGSSGQDGDLPVQLELFERSLPDRPYCTDDFAHGLLVRPRNVAKYRRYIQPQPPWLRLWLMFDYDHDCAWCAADEAGLPAPTITVINRRNGHGHLLYGIDTPVRMENWGGRQAPARYLADVERAMTAQLGADPSYSGFTCKNPLHRHWVTLSSDHPYSLGELHGWLGDLNEYHLPERVIGVGRNVETFDWLRRWAYRNVLRHKAAGGTLETWREVCISEAIRFTQEHHHPPLHTAECGWVGSSVSRWTFERFTLEQFAEIQAQRGRGGKTVVAEREKRHQHIHELHAAGYTQVLVARVMGVSTKTVGRVIHNGTKPYQDNRPPGRESEKVPPSSPAPPAPVFKEADRTIAHGLLQEARSVPIDWKTLRAASGWTENEMRQMDADRERLGEDHAYHLWLEKATEERGADSRP